MSKVILQDGIPPRTVLRSAQMAEKLEVPSVAFFVEQTVDIPVQGGGVDLRGDPHAFLPEQGSSTLSGAEHSGLHASPPQTVFNSISCCSGHKSTAFRGEQRHGLLPRQNLTALHGAEHHDHPGFVSQDRVLQHFVEQNIMITKALSQGRVQQLVVELWVQQLVVDVPDVGVLMPPQPLDRVGMCVGEEGSAMDFSSGSTRKTEMDARGEEDQGR